MFPFLFLFLNHLLRSRSHFESIINWSFKRIQSSYIHLTSSSLFIYCIVFFSSLPSLSSLSFIFLFIFSLVLVLVLHNFPWITLSSSSHFLQWRHSFSKKLAFPCFFSFFSIHFFPLVSWSSSTGITIQFGLFDLLNVFLHIEYNFKIFSRYYSGFIILHFLLVLFEILAFFYTSCTVIIRDQCVVFLSYILSRDCSFEYELVSLLVGF